VQLQIACQNINFFVIVGSHSLNLANKSFLEEEEKGSFTFLHTGEYLRKKGP
jgi:hypothetical protein